MPHAWVLDSPGSQRTGTRDARWRGNLLPCRLDAVVGHIRRTDRGLARQRATAHSQNTRRDRAGLHFWLGALRRARRAGHRHALLRSLSSPQGTPEEVWFRARASSRDRERSACQGVSPCAHDSDRCRCPEIPVNAIFIDQGVRVSVTL
jgi:hypothetical protein